jgi:predicted nucleic-acid-binding Zn-ribbon protein
MKQSNERICPTCMCTGREVRKIDDPMANVNGWRLIDMTNEIYERFCKRCNGTGFIPIAKTVPTIPRRALKGE